MQSGKVLPVIRQFFTPSIKSKSATDSQSQNSNQQQKEREPSEDEAKKAFEILLTQEEFKAQGLKVELQTIDGRLSIVVSDAKGNQLRVLRGSAIVSILQTSALGKDTHFRGRILDRRL